MPSIAIETMDALDIEVVGADRPHGDPVVVLLHGFDMLPRDLSPLAASLALPFRFVLPRAPIDLRVRGMRGCAWWECDDGSQDSSQDVSHDRSEQSDLSNQVPEGLAEARIQVAALLGSIKERYAPRLLVLGGFSQGAMLSLDVALRSDPFPEALVLLSGTRLAARAWDPLLPRLANQRIFQSHGRGDRDLPFAGAERLHRSMVDAGAHVTWVPFSGGHETPLVVWRQVRNFLSSLVTTQVHG